MGKRKKLEKAAKKTYKRAVAAIEDAVEAAAKVDKDAKKRARALRERLPDRPDHRAGSGNRGASAESNRGGSDETGGVGAAAATIDLTPPLPTVTEESDGDGSELDGLTVQALRDVARARDLRNVSRLTKAQLIERLES